jgi:putative transposase
LLYSTCRKYGRTGRLWASRYHSTIVDEEAYLWTVARYIEQNPVRAVLVENPKDYPYSSAPAHFGLTYDPVLEDDLFPGVQRDDYVKFMQLRVPEKEIKEIRQSAKTGRPLGTEKFVSEIENRLGRKLAASPVGRPRIIRP